MKRLKCEKFKKDLYSSSRIFAHIKFLFQKGFFTIVILVLGKVPHGHSTYMYSMSMAIGYRAVAPTEFTEYITQSTSTYKSMAIDHRVAPTEFSGYLTQRWWAYSSWAIG